MIENVYLAPESGLETEDYADLCKILEALYPRINRYWFAEFSQIYQSAGLMAIVDYTRITILLGTLNRYRDLLISGMEDVAALSDSAIQMSETCKALQSIQEQLALICINVHEIEGVVSDLSREDSDSFYKHIYQDLNDAGIDVQLELDLGI